MGKQVTLGDLSVLCLLRNTVQGLCSPEPWKYLITHSFLGRLLSDWWISWVLCFSSISFDPLILLLLPGTLFHYTSSKGVTEHRKWGGGIKSVRPIANHPLVRKAQWS